ncbi:hypothetical protein [Enterococcus sp. DIV0660C]|uniref:hypothetical protein n=1 Tax=Enterococcus sp. DIV0660C TaxID=2230880 RepID=UPI001A8D96E5|nr:hypothetical protein [Enterococcus sp. DIV0660C]MBO0432608.1 hypothetical protein [Enterococcus sp. DIV0660C]
MFEENFREVGLTFVELPIELVDGRPVYRGYLKELPTINAQGESRKTMQQRLATIYQAYRTEMLEELDEEKEKTMNLSVDELLRYYDGETFDGFSIHEGNFETDSENYWN